MRILIPITFAVLSACLALACLLLGCDLIPQSEAIHLGPGAGEPDIIDTTVIYDQPLPCPPETVFAMPPGRWVTSEFFCYWCEVSEHLETWPDSVFIPRKE